MLADQGRTAALVRTCALRGQAAKGRPLVVTLVAAALGTLAGCAPAPPPTTRCERHVRPAVGLAARCGAGPPKFQLTKVAVQADEVRRQEAIVDVDGDGREEVFILRRRQNYEVWRWAVGPGLVKMESGVLEPGAGALSKEYALLGVGDLNGDGRADLLLRAFANWFEEFRIWIRSKEMGYGPGIGSFVLNNRKESLHGGRQHLADFDCDGRVDLGGLHSTERLWLRVWHGDGSGAFPRFTDTAWEGDYTFNLPASELLGDLNGDGNPDLLALHDVSKGRGRISMYFGSVLGRFQRAIRVAAEPEWNAVTAADLDGDGRDEVVGVRLWEATEGGWNWRPGEVAVFSGEDGSLREQRKIGDLGGEPLLAGRFSCPGRIDLLLGNGLLVRTDEAGHLSAPIELTPKLEGAQRVVDLNGDGLDDLFGVWWDRRDPQSTSHFYLWINQTPQ